MALRLFLTAFATGVCLVLFLLITLTTFFKSEPGQSSRTAPPVASATLEVGADVGPSPATRITQQLQAQDTATPQPSPSATVAPEPSPTEEPPVQPPAPVAPLPPAGLTATYSSGQGVVLGWSPVQGAAYYNVYRSQVPEGGPGATYVALGSSGLPSFLDAAVFSGQTYYYVVTASAAGLESASSNEAPVKVP